ncbi:TIGR02444 family protein [Candidatus Puniceispirillum sp.]|nr:TIGR02444 family protein [Candidatus Puniceispirillum sp.]
MKSDSLWSFASSVYQKEGVGPACLALQNQCHVDIPMLFSIAFACGKGKKILKGDVINLKSLASPWQTDVVQALRHIRTQLKTGPHPAPNSKTAELREQVKVSELAAEKIQIEIMQSWIDNLKISYHKNSPPKLSIMIDSITIFVASNCRGAITPSQHKHIHCIGDAALQYIDKLKTTL